MVNFETVNYEGFYSGGYSSLSPDYGNFIGYRLPAGQLGSTTSMVTANQVNEVISRMKEGVKNVELQPLQPDVFEQIPKQQFAEIAALAKLSGVKPSIHAPMIDPAGFDQQRGYQGELGREDAERRLKAVIDKAHELDPKGNTPIAIHSSTGIPGREFRPAEGVEPGRPGRFKEHKNVIINRDNPREMRQIEEEKMFRPGAPETLEPGKPIEKQKGKIFTTEKRIASQNLTVWDQTLTNLAFYNKHADEIIGNSPAILADKLHKTFTQENFQSLTPEQQMAAKKMKDADIFLENVELQFHSAFEQAYKYGTPEQQKALKNLSEKYVGSLIEIEKHLVINKIPVIGLPQKKKEILEMAIQDLSNITKQWGPPKIWQPVEEFAIDKTAQTLGNVAFHGYEKYGKNAPIIAVENWQPEAAWSRAEDMKALLEKTKDSFVQTAMKEKGMSKSAARKEADRIIGMTLDVGHLNELRKFGFKEEDVVAEAKKMSKMVKHVHLTDNFGYSDSHLAPGMGNVPIKKILENLEKAGAFEKRGEMGGARTIVEAGALTNPQLGLRMSPHAWTLKAFGSGIYGAKMAPFWNQVADTRGAYFGFPMAYMPEKHFSLYGSGFASLPEELGGQIPGTASRFSGTANA